MDISAGPYASGQKPKGFGDIVSEKISEVSPIEKAKAKEDDFVRKQAEKELSKKDTYAKSAIRGAKTLGTTVITGLKDLDTGLSILGKKVRDTFGIKDTDLDEELESKLDDNQVVSIVRDYQKKVDNQAQEIQKLREQTGGSGITENISKGNYAKALDYTGKTFVESLAPSLMFLTPLTATMSMGKTVGDEMQQAKSEGRIPTATDVTAGAIKGAAEYALTVFLGVGKVTKKAVNETLFRKEASDAITKMIKSSFGKKVATTIGEEGFEEGLTQVVNNGVDIVLKGDKTKGWFDGVPDNVIVGMFGGGTQGTIANLILDKAEKEQAKEGTPTISDPNQPELPPDAGGSGDLMSPEGMQQVGVEPQQPLLDLEKVDPIIKGYIEDLKKDLNEDLNYYTERANARKPKNILQKGVKVIDKLLGGRDSYKADTNKAENIKNQLKLLENDPIAYYEERLNKANERISTIKDEDSLLAAKSDSDYYNYMLEGLKNSQQSQEQSPQQPTFEDAMSYSQNQGDSPNADADNIDLTQLVKAKEVVQKIIDNDGVATSIDGTPVDIQELNEQGEVVLQDGNIVSMSDITVHSELGDNPLVDVVNAELDNEQQVPNSQPEQQQTQPTELPKKIFHATKASFEGLPSRQEQSKVSAFGTEPAGTFYSTNPDRAKQAIGDGGDARIIEADFNPKNPLVIENTDNEVYSNIKNESEQQAIQELNDKYIESGVDLTTLEEGELPEEVNKRTTEIFADKLREQGYDAVINNENGDIIVLDDAIVTEKKAEPKAAPTNEIEKSQQIQELQDELDALDAQDDSKLTEKERKRIKNAIRYTVTSIARGYFLDGGKILWDSLKKETGFKGGEFKDFLGIVSKTGRTVNGIAQHLWETGDNDNFITRDYRDAIIEILNEPRDEWYVRQRNEVDADNNQNVLEQKQKIQEQIDILKDADLSFEDIKNELEANEAMWQQKFEQEGVPKQKSGTFVNKELESDIPKALEYLAKMKELEDGTKKRNMQSKIDEITAKDPKLKKIIENFDTILKQLNYTSNC